MGILYYGYVAALFPNDFEKEVSDEKII